MGQIGEGHGTLVSFDQAQAFTTGSNSAGYTLTSVEIDMDTNAENATPFTVSIHSNSSGCIAPGSLDTSLSHAAGLSDIAVCHA